MTRSVCILAFDQMEALDFAGPSEVLTTANRMAQRLGLDQPFAVSSVAGASTIRTRAGLTILADRLLRDVADVDVVVVPGGATSDVEHDVGVRTWLASVAPRPDVVASVCTGVFLLAAAGVVTDQEVTTHWEDVDELSERYPDLRVRRDVRRVDQGSLVTSAGISAGIDMSLHLVERLVSTVLAVATAPSWIMTGDNDERRRRPTERMTT